jgi:hypothetical protein
MAAASLIVFTQKPDGELVRWELGRAWAKFVLNGELEYLPSPTGSMEPIVMTFPRAEPNNKQRSQLEI